jgi:hypothetical protein
MTPPVAVNPDGGTTEPAASVPVLENTSRYAAIGLF